MTRRQLIGLAGLGSALLLAAAFAFQALGYAPCAMCLWQRWPHAVAAALGALGFVLPASVIVLAGAASVATSAGLGLFHTGVERSWWDGPATCGAASPSGMTPEQLMEQIMSAPLVRCDEVAWQFLGLSMASWNAVASLALVALWLMALRRS
ncbi:MAG: disulfide bond formation protein B [Pseudomonadota bacterium]